VAWWQGDGDANDTTGGNTSTLAGGVTFAAGEVAQCFQFNGQNQEVVVPDASSLNLSAGFTIEAWVNFADLNSPHPIVCKGNWGYHQYCLLTGGLGPSDELELLVESQGQYDYSGALTTSGAQLLPNTWYHIAATADGVTKSIYLNGQLLTNNPAPAPYTPNSNPVEIGRAANFAGAYFHSGLIDEISIYDRALTQNELQAIYSSATAGKCESSLPFVLSTSPSGFAVSPSAAVRIRIHDAQTLLDTNTVQLFLNGNAVNPTITKPAGTNVTTISYSPPAGLPPFTNVVACVFANDATPPVLQTNQFSFLVLPGVINVTSFNTGVDDSGAVLPNYTVDLHYTLLVSADSRFPGPGAVVVDDTLFPIATGNWIANSSTSKWIGPQGNQDYLNDVSHGDAVGEYIYRTVFDLTGYDPQSVQLVGQWTCDSVGTDVRINGASTSNATITNLFADAQWQSLLITNGFVPGTNNLDFVVERAPFGGPTYLPTGLRAEFVISNLQPAAQTYDVAADFSAGQNPNGPWSYGYTITLGGELSLYTNTMSLSGLNFWLYDLGLSDPQVHYNPTSGTVDNSTQEVKAGGFGLHPGPDGEYSVARFTAPATGEYYVAGSFFGEDTSGTSTDVHILTNGVSVFDGEVTGFGPGTGPSFYIQVTLGAGEHVDFAVGYGTNGNFYNDSTGLSAQIVSVSRPSPITPLLSIQSDGGGGFFIRLNGTSGSTYQLQRASSLTGQWIIIDTNTAPPSGIVEFHQTNTPPVHAFYRTAQQ
jgi:hypothetical protein